jgi:hypothetical protein
MAGAPASQKHSVKTGEEERDVEGEKHGLLLELLVSAATMGGLDFAVAQVPPPSSTFNAHDRRELYSGYVRRPVARMAAEVHGGGRMRARVW